jgi:NAD(P)-dependent dehydrogenase (short-subunit alcohol dehydrogenase family)
MAERLKGKVALITGASRGFGRATAQLLAREGAQVVLNYRGSEAEARSLAEETGGRAIRADLSDPAQAQQLAHDALSAFGRVDVLINNAGMMDVGYFADQQLPSWSSTIATNVFGVLALTHALLPSMRAQKSGRIICLASQLGHVGGERMAVYSGTKGFMLAFSKSLAREVGPDGITVNCVCPGSIVTDLNREIIPPERQKARAAELPLRRLGETTDVGEAVLFLAADSGRFITGQCVDVNGGATMA